MRSAALENTPEGSGLFGCRLHEFNRHVVLLLRQRRPYALHAPLNRSDHAGLKRHGDALLFKLDRERLVLGCCDGQLQPCAAFVEVEADAFTVPFQARTTWLKRGTINFTAITFRRGNRGTRHLLSCCLASGL